MSNDRVDAALNLLAPHLVTLQEPLYFRNLLEDLYDGAQDDLLADMIGTADAAAIWDVSRQRAALYIAQLHAKYGYGRLVGGAWIIRRAHVVSSPPDARYRARRNIAERR